VTEVHGQQRLTRPALRVPVESAFPGLTTDRAVRESFVVEDAVIEEPIGSFVHR